MYFDNLNKYSNKEVGGNDRFYFEKFICMIYIFFFIFNRKVWKCWLLKLFIYMFLVWGIV